MFNLTGKVGHCHWMPSTGLGQRNMALRHSNAGADIVGVIEVISAETIDFAFKKQVGNFTNRDCRHEARMGAWLTCFKRGYYYLGKVDILLINAWHHFVVTTPLILPEKRLDDVMNLPISKYSSLCPKGFAKNKLFAQGTPRQYY